MAAMRTQAYNRFCTGIVGAVLLAVAVALTGATGCDSKKTAPPPGAPTETETPSVDVGSESSAPTDNTTPKETTGDANASPDGAGSPGK
jgi:hypothetical protein